MAVCISELQLTLNNTVLFKIRLNDNLIFLTGEDLYKTFFLIVN